MTTDVARFAAYLADIGAVGVEMEHQRILPRTLIRVDIPDDAIDAVFRAADECGIHITNVGGRQVTFVVYDEQVPAVSAALPSPEPIAISPTDTVS